MHSAAVSFIRDQDGSTEYANGATGLSQVTPSRPTSELAEALETIIELCSHRRGNNERTGAETAGRNSGNTPFECFHVSGCCEMAEEAFSRSLRQPILSLL